MAARLGAPHLRIPGVVAVKTGDVVRCKADWWQNAYGDRTYAVTWHDPPRMVIDTKRVGGAKFLKFEDVPDCWFWDDGFEKAALN